MPGLILLGEAIEVPGLSICNFLDEKRLSLTMGEDMRLRNTRWVRGIVVHTTKGIWPQTVKPGLGPGTSLSSRIARLWSTDHRNAGAHLSVDWDGLIGCHCDLIKHAAYHAGVVNEVTVGIEVYQGDRPEAEVYADQLDVVVKLIDALTRLLHIQRQMVHPSTFGVVPRIAAGAKDVVGVYGHRHVTHDRGRGDPGDAIFERLALAGYEVRDFQHGEDIVVWKDRQSTILGLVSFRDVDGIAGPSTCDALRFKGYRDGLWVSRP